LVVLSAISSTGYVGLVNQNYERAQVLIDRHRPKDAESEIRRHLAAKPDDPWGHSLLATALIMQKKNEAALASAKQAVALNAHEAWFHYVLADIYYSMDLLRDAKIALEEALRLVPTNARYWGLLANVECAMGEWEKALNAAESGLQQDSDYVHCKNLRALALAKLGRKDDARNTVNDALADNPEDSLSFAYTGWTHLHNGEPHAAMDAFAEALRLDPQCDLARGGMMAAIRETHPLLVLSRKIVGLQVDELGDNMAKACMLFHKQGRRLLTEEERRRSLWMLAGVPIGLMLGIGLAVIQRSHAIQWPTSGFNGHCLVLLGINLLLVLVLFVTIAQSKTPELKRASTARILAYGWVLPPLTVLMFIIQYAPKSISTAVCVAIVPLAFIGLFTSHPERMGKAMRDRIEQWVYKIWPT
jgi:tetratricopeptide (TPR) repeat protein